VRRDIHPVMNIPVPWVFILAYLIGFVVQLYLPVRLRPGVSATVIREVGLTFVGIGIVIAFSALGIFRKRRTTTIPFETPSALVTAGPYRFTRNPMYLGLTLIYIGVAGTRLEPWPLIVLPFLLAYINFVVIPFEERRLADTFGDQYRRYRAGVRRWF
jgi:protein-S-isoprenylcysteine O-methyltransferase Ste14